MIFSYASKKLKKQLTDDKQMKKSFGNRISKKLRLRLGVLAQAATLADVPREPPDRCHQLAADRDEHFAVDLSRNKRLEFKPDHDPTPRKSDGGIDPEGVTDIKLLGVVDYHWALMYGEQYMTISRTQIDGWQPNWATHPGEHLEEHLEVRSWSQADFARLSGLSTKLVSEIINRKNPVSPETAIKLERVLGMKASIWTGLQAAWDLHIIRKGEEEICANDLQWM